LSAIERGLNFVSADLLEQLALSLEIPVFFLFVLAKVTKKVTKLSENPLDTIVTA
jgi:hypothetical protein